MGSSIHGVEQLQVRSFDTWLSAREVNERSDAALTWGESEENVIGIVRVSVTFS